MYLKHGGYYFVDKANKWHNLGRDYYEALRQYAELHINVIVQGTLNEVFTRYARDVLTQKRRATQKKEGAYLEILRRTFGHMLPHEVTVPHIYSFMDALKEKKTTANRIKGLLSHVYTYAVRWGIVDKNPCRDVASFKEKPRDRYVTDEEFWLVYDAVPEDIGRIMLLAVCTGLRISDILALSRTNIRTDGLYVQPAKTRGSSGKRLLFVWTSELRSLIHDKEDPQFPNKQGTPMTYASVRKYWVRAQTAVFPNSEDRFTIHDLRAKAGSDSETGALLGHTDKRTLERHYRRKPERVQPVHIPKTS
jgi:integrase